MKIVIPGGSGQVGGILARAFRARGDDVVLVSRGGPADGAGTRIVAWDARTLGPWAARWMAELGAFVLHTDAELLLKSRRAVPTRLLDAGFRFERPEWPAATRDLVER